MTTTGASGKSESGKDSTMTTTAAKNAKDTSQSPFSVSSLKGSGPKGSNKDNKQKEHTGSPGPNADGEANKGASGEVDKYKKFENEGVVIKAKLIGSELVMEPRGDKMCQNSIQRLKAIIKGTNSHKKRIVIKISYDGVKVYDEKTNEILHHHEVSQISFISGDDTDTRTFGYVSDVPNNAHQFICFKTSGPAMNVMSEISGLFEAVLEKKNQATPPPSETDQSIATTAKANTDGSPANKMAGKSTAELLRQQQSQSQQQESIDLISDSGIMDGADSSGIFGIGGVGGDTSLFGGAGNSSLITGGANASASGGEGGLSFVFGGSIFDNNNNTSTTGRPTPNRSLVYNHTSVSLSDAALTRQSSFTEPPVPPTLNNSADSYVDRYAVFNDIDNLPSIFESASLGSVNNVGISNNNLNNFGPGIGAINPQINPSSSFGSGMLMRSSTIQQQQQLQQLHQQASISAAAAPLRAFSGHTSSSLPSPSPSFQRQHKPLQQQQRQPTMTTTATDPNIMFRQTNPFDDDFFA